MTPVCHIPYISQALSQIFPTKTSQCIVLEIAKQGGSKKFVSLSQATLAKKADVRREAANINANNLCAIGVIEKVRNPHNGFDICQYKLTDLGRFLLPSIRALYNATKYGLFSISLLLPAAKPDRTPISYMEKSLSKECSSVRERQTASVRATPENGLVTESNDSPSDYELWSGEIRRLKKERLRMIPDYVERLTPLLYLTDKGKYKLSSFNEETIDHGLLFFKSRKSCSFRDMLEECTRYAKEKRYSIDWSSFYQAQKAGLFSESDFYANKPMHGAKTQRSEAKPQLSSEQMQAREDRSAQLLAREREKMQEKTRQWMASKTPEQINHNIALVSDGMDRLMQDAGVSAADRSQILSSAMTAVTAPTVKAPEKKKLTEKQLQVIDTKRETVRKLEADPNLNEFARIILNGFKAQLKEFDEEYGAVWSVEDQGIVDWFVGYFQTLTVDNQACCQSLFDEVNLGPSSPRAITGELQTGLRLMKEILEGQYVPTVSPVVESSQESIPLEAKGYEEVPD